MALIVETGSIVVNADSYISQADAITFLDGYYGEYDEEAAAFLGLSSTRKDIILRRAAYDLDRKYALKYKGYKIVQTQELCGPRYNVVDEDGFEVPSTSIPRRIQRAQCEVGNFQHSQQAHDCGLG